MCMCVCVDLCVVANVYVLTCVLTFAHVLQVACFSQSDELWQFFTDSRCIVGVPPELEEENARHAQVLPTDNEP